MTNAEAIEILRANYPDACFEQLRAAVDKAIKALEAQEWIPCKVRLPFAEYGESDKVLATCGYLNVADTSIRWIKTLYFNGCNWCYPTGETYDQKVYAWMPLPECYQEDI